VAALLGLAVPAQAHEDHAGNAEAGEKLFLLCRACHQIGPGARNMTGPELNGVIGRPAGAIPAFPYSPALRSSGIVWTEDALTAFLHHPKGRVPGTRMIFPGFKDAAQIADVIAFLRRFPAP
jgi:cytochrome c